VLWINSRTVIVTVEAQVLVSSQAVLAHPCSGTGFCRGFPWYFLDILRVSGMLDY
jgi:hypothetical protein